MKVNCIFSCNNRIRLYVFELLPWHVRPSPVKPGLHVHVKVPTELEQSAFSSQVSVLVAHSSISETK